MRDLSNTALNHTILESLAVVISSLSQKFSPWFKVTKSISPMLGSLKSRYSMEKWVYLQ
jgi:hypothetical protein